MTPGKTRRRRSRQKLDMKRISNDYMKEGGGNIEAFLAEIFKRKKTQ